MTLNGKEETVKTFVWISSKNSASDGVCDICTVLGSIPASFGTVESEGRQMKQC